MSSVLVCGRFTTINNPTFDSLAAWNGTTLTKPYTASLYAYLGVPSKASLDPAYIGGVVRRANGDLYLSIYYTQTGMGTPYKGLYRWNGTAWSTISTAVVKALDIHTASDTVYFLVCPDGGGASIYKLAPASNTPVLIGESNAMDPRGCLAVNQTSGDLYYGSDGFLTNMLNPTVAIESLSRYSDGVWTAFGEDSMNQPYPKKMVVSPSGYVYVIDMLGRLWFWMGAEWHYFTDTSQKPYDTQHFRAICCGPASDNPYVAYYDGSPAGGVYQMDITKFDAVGFQTQMGTKQPMLIATLAVHAGYLYAGGASSVITESGMVSRSDGELNSYSPMGGSLGFGLCKINLTSGDWQTLSASDPAGVDGEVSSLYSSGGNLYLGGEFSYSLTGATSVRSLAITDPSDNLLKKLGATWYNGVETTATIFKAEYAPNGDLYLLTNGTTVYDDAGSPTSVPALAGSLNVACWNGTTWSFPVTTIGSMGGENLNTMAVCPFTGQLYVGGAFYEVNGVSATNIARYSGGTWNALGGLNGPSGEVTAIKVLNSEVIFVNWNTGPFLRWEAIKSPEGENGYWNTVQDFSTYTYVDAMSVDPLSGTLYAAVDGTRYAAQSLTQGGSRGWMSLGNIDSLLSVAFIHMDGVTAHIAGSFDGVGAVTSHCVMRWSQATNTFSAWGSDPTYFSNVRITGGLEHGGNYYFTSIGTNMYSSPGVALMYRWDGANFLPYSIALGETTRIAPVPDSEAPVAGGGGTITISWLLALDRATQQSDLQYKVYHSLSSSMNTVSEVEANGTPLTAWETGMSSITLPSDTYRNHYFNILVKDVDGNKGVYTKVFATQGTIYVTGTEVWEPSGGFIDVVNDVVVTGTGRLTLNIPTLNELRLAVGKTIRGLPGARINLDHIGGVNVIGGTLYQYN